MIKISPDKAYILGLLVGSGELSTTTFRITLPFNKWGNDAYRMNTIARDILKQISSKFEDEYGLQINYEIQNNQWIIYLDDNKSIQSIIADLKELKLPTVGFLLEKANLSYLKEQYTKKAFNRASAETFLSGIFDARASVTKSHRRFTDDAPIVSIEIPGSTQNFLFVMQLCSWLNELGSITDQILYNHPCQHSSIDPTYKGWKKGFKIRFLAKSFLAVNSFALKAKATEIIELEKRQTRQQQLPCNEREPRERHYLSIHEDIHTADLPPEVRSRLFLHYHHICAVVKCPFAPYSSLKAFVKDSLSFVSFFPIQIKEFEWKQLSILHKKLITEYFGVTPITSSLTVERLLQNYTDYPELENGIAFLFAVELMGKRHRGNKDEILRGCKQDRVTLHYTDAQSNAPILVCNNKNGRGVILSSPKNKTNQKLVSSQCNVNGLVVEVKNDEGN